MGRTGSGHRRRRPHRSMAGTAVFVALAAAVDDACSGGDERADGHLDERSVTSVGNTGPVVVQLADHDVVDGTVEVPVGEAVRWDNHDTSAHQLVPLTGDVIRSPVLSQAASYTARFEAPGEYPYYCNIHDYTKGRVVAAEPPAPPRHHPHRRGHADVDEDPPPGGRG